MKVALLECDQVLEKFQSEFGQYSSMIQQMFTSVGAHFEFDVFDCQKGQYPLNIDDYDFFITTGSKSDAYAKSDWIKQLIEFVQRLNKANKKLIGICFGHQIIALALGGKVEKSTRGWGIGLSHNQIVAKPTWIKEKSETLNIIVSHQDQIIDLPENALVIAKSDFCPYFMVQWNDHFLSIQGHPEWQKNYSKVLINDRRNRISKPVIEAGLASLSEKPDNLLFTRWVLDFVQRL